MNIQIRGRLLCLLFLDVSDKVSFRCLSIWVKHWYSKWKTHEGMRFIVCVVSVTIVTAPWNRFYSKSSLNITLVCTIKGQNQNRKGQIQSWQFAVMLINFNRAKFTILTSKWHWKANGRPDVSENAPQLWSHVASAEVPLHVFFF